VGAEVPIGEILGTNVQSFGNPDRPDLPKYRLSVALLRAHEAVYILERISAKGGLRQLPGRTRTCRNDQGILIPSMDRGNTGTRLVFLLV